MKIIFMDKSLTLKYCIYFMFILCLLHLRYIILSMRVIQGILTQK